MRVRVEAVRLKTERYVVERPVEDIEDNVQQLLERIVSYGRDRNVQLLQLFDSSLLSSRGAYNQKKIFETLKELYDECMEYQRTMIVYDLDSLIGINESQYTSSVGLSTTMSLANEGVYNYITRRFLGARIEEKGADPTTNNKECWAIAIVRNSFLLENFTADVDFALSESQKREEENRKQDELVQCVKCREIYIENENNITACRHHGGFVYDNLSDDLKSWTPTDAIRQLNDEDCLIFTTAGNEKFREELGKKKQRVKYICCSAVLYAGATFGGCKKSKHGWDGLERFKAEFPGISNDPIAAWEKAHLTDRKNLERKLVLLTERLNLRTKYSTT